MKQLSNQNKKLEVAEPKLVLENYKELLEKLRGMIKEQKKKSKIPMTALINKIGLTTTQFYWRLNHPEAWTLEELTILLNELDIRQERTTK